MGGSSSKATINSLQQVITDVSMSTVQDCVTISEQSQTVDLSNSGISIGDTGKVTQQTDISTTCFSNTAKEADLQNKIIAAISNASDASGVGLLSAFGVSLADATTNLNTLVRNNIKMSNIQKTYNMMKQQQNVRAVNTGFSLFRTVEVSQGAKLFAAATVQEVTNAGIFNTIQSKLDQSATATITNPLAPLFAALGAGSVMIMILVIVIVIVLGVLAYNFNPLKVLTG